MTEMVKSFIRKSKSSIFEGRSSDTLALQPHESVHAIEKKELAHHIDESHEEEV